MLECYWNILDLNKFHIYDRAFLAWVSSNEPNGVKLRLKTANGSLSDGISDNTLSAEIFNDTSMKIMLYIHPLDIFIKNISTKIIITLFTGGSNITTIP